MRDPEANPFPAADAARRAIWEMLVPRDIDAFLAADWAPVAGDFVEANFTGLNARFLPSPDDWRLSFPTLAAYRDEWLRQAREAKAAREAGLYAEDARAAIFRATRLEEIEIDGAAALVAQALRRRDQAGGRRARPDELADALHLPARRRAVEDRRVRRLPAAREGAERCASSPRRWRPRRTPSRRSSSTGAASRVRSTRRPGSIRRRRRSAPRRSPSGGGSAARRAGR